MVGNQSSVLGYFIASDSFYLQIRRSKHDHSSIFFSGWSI